MPLTSKGTDILKNMESEYGAKKGKSVFYASKNSHRISGVDQIAHRFRDALRRDFVVGDALRYARDAGSDKHWITVHPKGSHPGEPILLKGSKVVGGAGGSMTGETLSPKSESKPVASKAPQVPAENSKPSMQNVVEKLQAKKSKSTKQTLATAKPQGKKAGTADNPNFVDTDRLPIVEIANNAEYTSLDHLNGDELHGDNYGFSDHQKKLSPQAKSGVFEYRNSGGGGVNDFLRGYSGASAKTRAAITGLDEATNHKISKPLVVYRAPGSESGMSPENMKIGDSFTDKAFVSTSLDPNHSANEFGHSEDVSYDGRKKILFRIELPKGSRSQYIGNILEGERYDRMSKMEQEVLLPRGTKFIVVGHTSTGKDHYIELRAVTTDGIAPL